MNDEEIKRWISVQRSFYKRGVLQEWKVKALNQFNFSWSRLDNNNLAMKYPLLLKEWDYDKNVNIDPNNVSFGSYKKVWWKCEKNHSWKAVISNRTCLKRNCPYCSGNMLLYENSLHSRYPELVKHWHPTKNELTPREIAAKSGKNFIWVCNNNHEFEKSVDSVTKSFDVTNGKKIGCPVCNIGAPISATHLFILKEWDYDKNVNIDPNNVSFGSYKKVWWKCEKNHSWRSKVSHRTSGSACPYCYGTKACKDNCLQTINPDISKYWHSTKNGKITPSDVTLGSGKQVWWKCRNCKKPYKTAVKNRVKSRFGFCGKCRIDKKVKN